MTLSAGENGITSYRITPSGGAILTDSLGNHDGLWISGATALQTAVVGGQTFAIIASVTSDSLSVVRVNDMGCLFLTDHVTDDLDSRFRGASALDVFEVAGRSFVVAGGSDAGLTLFEILPGGALSHVSSTAFETGQGMGNIASIDVAVSGGIAQVYVIEESGARLQVFELDLGDLGLLITASGAEATGGALDDRIIGTSGGQVLSGGGGDDVLHDGSGADWLIGGAGADVYVLMADGATDTIADFEDGIDRIDLSDWGMIYSASALLITGTATGATISYGGQQLVITSADGGTLAPGSLGDDDFIF
ncbi:MAG: M10 family metallopeptidase C-terminal domain-containing protein [Paracoccaceae bacterium]